MSAGYLSSSEVLVIVEDALNEAWGTARGQRAAQPFMFGTDVQCYLVGPAMDGPTAGLLTLTCTAGQRHSPWQPTAVWGALALNGHRIAPNLHPEQPGEITRAKPRPGTRHNYFHIFWRSLASSLTETWPTIKRFSFCLFLSNLSRAFCTPPHW